MNLDAIKRRRDEVLKLDDLHPMIRLFLLEDVSWLIGEVECSNNPSGGEWRIEEYSTFQKLKNGEKAEYRCKRWVTNQNGKKIVRHIKGSCRRVNGTK